LELIIPILDVNDELILDILSGKKKNIVLVKNEKSLIIQLKKTLEKKTNKNRDKRKDTLIKNYFFNKSSKKNMRLFC